MVTSDGGSRASTRRRRLGRAWSSKDLLLAVSVAVLSIVTFVDRVSVVLETDEGDLHSRTPDLLGVALVFLGCAALLSRRATPGIVLAVVVATEVVRNAFDYPLLPLPYALLIAVYTAGQRWPLHKALPALVAVCLIVGASVIALIGPAVDDEWLTRVLGMVAAWALGRGDQLRRTRARLLEERAGILEDRAHRLLQEQAAIGALSAAQERARIARELHDTLASHLAIMVTRAASTRRRLPEGSEGEAALASIEDVGRQALKDMRQLVGVLHPVEGDAAVGATPFLDRVEDLVRTVASAGIAIDLEVVGPRRRLQGVLELQAYRILQEAITNALLHAAGSPVQVRLSFASDHLRIRVRDHGPTSPAAAPGPGLQGINDRVAQCGGSMTAGPLPRGGFVVDAVLPLSVAEVPG
ncbi:MAG TPA: histidine kinase [Intrasporangium sp.]|uniref:sensor histidine kinase n=1 Tax=Intrasporangium sp. TaxID=1925024 RepID=UPI002D78775F|nr:histidine kinase [Intrasporangium sp.]HET7398006.1 histidine kinase [Intrasporangium sp.]